jgi:MFS family permease
MTDITADIAPALLGAAAPPAAESSHARRWLALPVLLAGSFLLVVDFSIVNVAMPSIRESLGASDGELQLIIAFYAAAYAVLLITGGRLGDLFGRKTMFIGGMAGFMAAA